MRALRSLPGSIYMGIVMVFLGFWARDVRGLYVACALFVVGAVHLARGNRPADR